MEGLFTFPQNLWCYRLIAAPKEMPETEAKKLPKSLSDTGCQVKLMDRTLEAEPR